MRDVESGLLLLLLMAVMDAVSADVVVDRNSSVFISGCSDGQREWFTNMSLHPNIAGCSGAWTSPGVLTNQGTPVTKTLCGRNAGDDSSNPQGTGCGAADLCAAGWRICTSPVEVESYSGTGDCDESASSPPGLFFVSAASGTGYGWCDGGGANDVFGCGTDGARLQGSCGVLSRFLGNECGSDNDGAWHCTDQGTGTYEAEYVINSNPLVGGVLCCKDACPMKDVGCADGTREWFTDLDKHPDIAGCNGGWSIPGLVQSADNSKPMTERYCAGEKNGNDSPTNPSGNGCSAADLCEEGWEICTDRYDAFFHSATHNCDQTSENVNDDMFFAAALATDGSCGLYQGILGCGKCISSGNAACSAEYCSGTFNTFSGTSCSNLRNSWECTGGAGNEAVTVTKSSSYGGGVLCCRKSQPINDSCYIDIPHTQSPRYTHRPTSTSNSSCAVDESSGSEGESVNSHPTIGVHGSPSSETVKRAILIVVLVSIIVPVYECIFVRKGKIYVSEFLVNVGYSICGGALMFVVYNFLGLINGMWHHDLKVYSIMAKISIWNFLPASRNLRQNQATAAEAKFEENGFWTHFARPVLIGLHKLLGALCYLTLVLFPFGIVHFSMAAHVRGGLYGKALVPKGEEVSVGKPIPPPTTEGEVVTGTEGELTQL